MTRRPFATFILFTLSAPLIAAEPLKPDAKITALLAEVRDKHKLPGLVGGVVEGGRVVAAGAVGVRKDGHDAAITVNDKLHLGSCTKAMTATMLATLVEEGKLSWDATMEKVFADQKSVLHPDLRGVTLEMLLTHRSGLRGNPDFAEVVRPGVAGPALRRSLFRKTLREAPEHKPGTNYLYSNLGYAVAGMMAETVTKKTWEELMRERLFGPLGMTSAGFGPPGARGKVDQPWGHRLKDGRLEALQDDNSAVIAPAGAVHCSLADWGRFISLHTRGSKGEEKLLKAETFRKLHAAPPEGQPYSLGWNLVRQPWANGLALNHAGSNTMWYALVWAAPERDLAFLAVTNQGGTELAKATNDTIAAVAEYWLKK